MAESMVSVEKIKAFYNNHVHNPPQWEMNKKLLRAVGLFAGSIIFMRSFGDLMAI
ncbi:hypothetical protein DCAR_0311465 [Daucus carota subsp. sativus]|uniref:Mitochondrial import receptor subunit TOM5 homolog n=1 Tax=Daucus carota subsp. sativus TaxID=79200 RepID=A0AAF1AQY4_DAUCS|nr:hypothetical protein DCAR_0311465 [Daucus carota subsp. sativus]